VIAAGRLRVWASAATAAAWVVATASLLHTPGGLQGVYSFVGGDGREREVTRRVDARLDFPVPQRIDAAYIFHWNYQAFGFPDAMPPYVIRWSGWLLAPREGTYGFTADANGEAAVSVDQAPLPLVPDAATPRTLNAGPHRLEVEYRVATGDARFVLSWQTPGGVLTPIPEANLRPDQASLQGGPGREIAGFLLFAAGLAAAGAVVVAARRRPSGPAAALVSQIRAERQPLAVAALLVLAALLRFHGHDYALVPFHHETADEYQHAWEGWHLVHTGEPVAWSTFPDRYPIDRTHDFRWFGDRYITVRPYFDHPPLFSLPVGLLCSLAGARSFLECTLPVMRLVPIVCSLFGLWLLIRLARAYGASERAALLAGLVYATLPVIVLTHRLVKAENLLAVLFMGAILAVRPERPGGDRRGAVVAGVLCALAIWTKATGVAVAGVAALLLLAQKRRRDAAIVCGLAAGGLLLYLGYAALYDFDIFLKVMKAQSTSKWVSSEAFVDLLYGKVVVKWFGRGTYLWLWMAAACLVTRRARLLLLPIAAYVALLAVNADHRVVYGWYRAPLYPFLCVAAGLYLDDWIEEPDLGRGFLFGVTAVASALLYALPEPWAQSRTLAWGFAILATAPFLPRILSDGKPARRLAAVGALALLILFLCANVATVNGALEIYSRTRGVQ
jgi:hypothetical protein